MAYQTIISRGENEYYIFGNMYFFAIQHMVAQEVESYRNCITIDVNTKRMEISCSEHQHC